MPERHTHVHCPITAPPTPDLAGLRPLLTRLESGAPLLADEHFVRGTLRDDGRLDLCKQQVGVLGCQALTRALRRDNVVQSLLLGTNGIGDEGAAEVAELVRQRPLRTLYLGCNLIGAAGAQALAEAVRVQPLVRALWLKRNPIGPQGASALASLLRANSALRTLDVVNTGIGDEGASELLRALAEGRTPLQYLYLSGNALTPAILPDVVAALEGCSSLRGLYLSVNALADAAGVLAESLKRPGRLRGLGLASNGIGDAALGALLRAASHGRLNVLDLGDAPSARTLGAPANRAGPETQAAASALMRQPGALQVLALPRLTAPAGLLDRKPPQLTVRITGQQVARGAPEGGVHPDAADIRSVYR